MSGGEKAGPRRRLPEVAAPLLSVVLPVLAYGAVSASQIGRRPMLGGDQAIIELWTRSASQGDAYLGPYSRFGWNHPGPAIFYYFAPFYRLSNERPGSLAVASVVAVVVGLGFVVWTVHRVLGRRAGWVTAAVLLGFLATAGIRWSDDTWNPVLIIVPLFVLGISAAATAEGHRWSFVAAVVSASVCVQTHIATLPVVVVLGLVAAGSVAVRWWRTPERWGGPVVVGVIAALVLWALPLYEQVTRHPGNMTQIFDVTQQTPATRHSWSRVAGLVAVQVTFPGRNLVERSLGGHPPAPSGMLTATAAALLGAGVLAAVRSGRRHQWFAAALCGFPLPATVMLAYSLVRVDGPIDPYITFSALSVGVLLVLGLALTAADLLRPRFPAVVPRLAPVAIGLISLVLAVGVFSHHLVDQVYARRPGVAHGQQVVGRIEG